MGGTPGGGKGRWLLIRRSRRFRNAQEEIAAEFKSEEIKGGLAPAVPVREDIRRMLELALAKFRDYLLLRLLYACGLRRQEVARLLVADILWDAGCLFIRASKGDKDRYVLVDAASLEGLREWVGEAGPERLVFEMTTYNVSRLFRYWAEKSGLYQKYQQLGRTLSPHSFRHPLLRERPGLFCHQPSYGPHLWRNHGHLHPHGQPPDRPRLRLQPTLCQLGNGEVGYFLPLFPFRSEMRQMLNLAQETPRDYLLLRILYASGIWLQQALESTSAEVIWAERKLRIGERAIRLDEGTLECLRDWPPALLAGARLFDMSIQEASAMIEGLAERVGVQRRFAAVGRRFTPEAIRYALPCILASEGWTGFP